ncbi:MAG: sulfotransferase [Amaricoccus sp.]|uniref:sulfotransferase family protein n=1 Tax=Amaricoccus sp. TaxID=1872485 RepID=UPI003315A892
MRSYSFICGCGHSGTSLLANMFASHPALYIPLIETNCFLVRAEARSRWKALRAEARASKLEHFAEKTPRHVRRISLIRRLVPDARFILMVRDGRDVAASFIRRKGSAEIGARRWLADNRLVRAEEGAPDVFVLRYEDLIADPEGALRGICEFTGFDFASEMLRFHETERLWFGVPELRRGTGEDGVQHALLRNWQINQPIFDGRGSWRDLLGPEDLALFDEDEARQMLAYFGYV